MEKPAIGTPAPDFKLPGDGGSQLSLADLRGRKIVLYFYPKDSTPGCTKQAIAFNDLRDQFLQADTMIIGVSADSPKSHDKFKGKHELQFPLLSDETKETLEKYGVWVEKSLYGRRYMGIERSTFLIDREGHIARIWEKVSVPGHAEEVLEAAKRL